MNPKPCPFCGGNNVLIIEGSTFRWRKAECQECQATAGEVRIEWAETALEDRIAVADKEALKVWNERAVATKDCKHCLFQHPEWKQDGFCYMFREEPTGDKCGQFKPVS